MSEIDAKITEEEQQKFAEKLVELLCTEDVFRELFMRAYLVSCHGFSHATSSDLRPFLLELEIDFHQDCTTEK